MAAGWDGERCIACTGLSGFVGTAIAPLRGRRFRMIDVFHRHRATSPGLCSHIALAIEHADHVAGEIERLEGTVFINLGGAASVDACERERNDHDGVAYQANVETPARLAEACGHAGIHFIHISTDYVFDGETGPYREDDTPTRAVNWYGETKRLGEQAVLEALPSATIVRIALPFGPRHPNKTDIVRLVRDRLDSGQPFHGVVDQLLSPTWVSDIGIALAWLIEQRRSGIYHCAGTTLLSAYEAALVTARTFGLDEHLIVPTTLEAITTSGRARRPRRPALLCERLTRESNGAIRLSGFAEGVGYLRDAEVQSPRD